MKARRGLMMEPCTVPSRRALEIEPNTDGLLEFTQAPGSVDRACAGFALSSVNECYRGTLELADMGWPDGLRWLHGEEGTQKEVYVGQEED